MRRMNKLHLMIVTPEKPVFEGDAERVFVRTLSGDVAILPRHIDYAAALGNGHAKFVIDGAEKHAEISGGLIQVADDRVHILTNDFSWSE